MIIGMVWFSWFGLVWFRERWIISFMVQHMSRLESLSDSLHLQIRISIGLVWLGWVDLLPHGKAHAQTREYLHLQVRIRTGMV